jgi:hypothetical protein
VCEIDFDNLKRVNASKTLDEIISESKLDYALGDYKTFTNAKSLLRELKK